MTDGTRTWNIGSAIPLELFVTDPDTGQGLTGQVGNITFTVQRSSDSKYWSGSAWAVTSTDLTVTEVGNGRYTYTLSATANAQADRYIVYARVDNPPLIDGAESFEIHVSRLLDLRTYESEPA